MKKIIFPFILLALLSCDKVNSRRQFFGEWLVLKKEQQDANGDWQDITKECEKDDSEAFRNMGKWYYFPGSLRCSNTDKEAVGSWNYESSEKRLVFANSANINTSEAIVESIDDNGMVLNMNIADTMKMRITYQRVK
ncbi:MAG: hypothetical protein J0G96_14070 [Flavobacteriia bacterium]|nr:hypothetical protein [Flavobacteriia bacterium]OJX39117.1 MAG: hypothetical protein BGO87_03800 [Flavobacteriia bacterium 40-80]